MKIRKWILQADNPDADMTVINKLLQREKLYRFSEVDYAESAENYGSDYIPVGDIPFVEGWLKKNYNKKMVPIEVPECLRKEEFLRRGYQFVQKKDIPFLCKQKKFIKNVDRLKCFNSALYEGVIPSEKVIPDGKYLVSDWINIMSEFRVFVYQDEILAVQPYLGQPLVFPNPDVIKRMVDVYKKDMLRPGSYTMDIAVCKDQSSVLHTAILEIHPFVSCGLYGFQSPELPDMLEAGIRYYAETQK